MRWNGNEERMAVTRETAKATEVKMVAIKRRGSLTQKIARYVERLDTHMVWR